VCQGLTERPPRATPTLSPLHLPASVAWLPATFLQPSSARSSQLSASARRHQADSQLSQAPIDAHQAIELAKHRKPACCTGESWLNFTDLSRRQFTGSRARRSLQPLTRLSFPWYARSLYSREMSARWQPRRTLYLYPLPSHLLPFYAACRLPLSACSRKLGPTRICSACSCRCCTWRSRSLF
jgi:hypothetical protein